MKMVIAPDSFKGSVSSVEASDQMEAGIKQVLPEMTAVKIPMADGGEGTVDAILAVTGGVKEYRTVQDPLGRPVEAAFGWVETDRLAIIETAAASGLPLLNEKERDPLQASTYGTGELVRHALDLDAEKIILGIGGSATVDGGTGFFQALGLQFLDEKGRELRACGKALAEMAEIRLEGLDPRLENIDITIASDVTNPLLGKNGAVAVFGPQKGVALGQLPFFEEGMRNFADCTEGLIGKQLKNEPGSGAAGGFGFSLQAFLNVRMTGGFQLIAEISGLEREIESADYVLTGEGKIDSQSLFGKVPVGIGQIARKYDVPTVIFTGKIEGDLKELRNAGLSIFMPIVDEPMTLEDAMENGTGLIKRAAERFGSMVEIVNKSKV